MADLINLRRARKAKKRVERKQTASEKRQLFGRAKTEKQAEAAARDRGERLIDGHRRDKN